MPAGGDRALAAAIQAVQCQWLSPLTGIVGAAALWPDGELIAAASRVAAPAVFAHAEAELLERIDEAGRLRDLPAARMASTLSPCLRGSKSRQGRACAERLVAHNISEIVVGHIDPTQPPLDEYRRIGLCVVLTGDERLRLICDRLAGIFDVYGERVNTEIGAIKERVGEGIFMV
jgi:pyrimidine deaminase RibD-like protein